MQGMRPCRAIYVPNLMKLQFLGSNTHALIRANVKFSVEDPIYGRLIYFFPRFTLIDA